MIVHIALFFKNSYLFIFDCTGSSFLLRLFLVASRRVTLVAVHKLLIAVASPVAEHSL